MKKYFCVLFLLFSFYSVALQYDVRDSTKNILVVTCVYEGKNAFVQNSCEQEFKETFCTDSVFINGKKWNAITNASPYEIDLSSFNIGTPIKMLIFHNEFCMPKMLTNGWPEAVSCITFTDFNINAQGEVHIETINSPNGKRLDLKISQCREFKWNTVLYIQQKKGIKNCYDTIVPLVPGINTFRVSENNTAPRYYADITVNSGIEPISCTIDSAKTSIKFADYVYYRLKNSEEATINWGYGKQININNLEPGSYIIFYENECLPFEIKRNEKTDN